jgi:hypothetical protein
MSGEDYTTERAVSELVADPDFRKELTPIILDRRFDDLPDLAKRWGRAEKSLFAVVRFLYGIKLSRYGDRVASGSV